MSSTLLRVLPDVPAIDKEFDYTVAPGVAVPIGSVVRVDLAGRRVGGWVVETEVEPTPGVIARPIAKLSGWGPDEGVLDLAVWGAWRWAGRRASLLRSASADFTVPNLPSPALAPPATPPRSDAASLAEQALSQPGATVLRLPPASDLTPVVACAARRGPVLVVVPSSGRAAVLAERLRRAGAAVALLPSGWAQARAGATVVVGARAAAWGPCSGVSSIVVIDGHDEALTQEQAPTWDAVPVAVERARRADIPCVITSPCPTLELLAFTDRVLAPSADAERNGWAAVEVVDRRGDDPRLGLWSPRVVELARSQARVVCILNRKGRAKLVACRACGCVARCERCGGAVVESAEADLVCSRCGERRPVLCKECGSISVRRLRLGVSRAREELEALAGRPALEISGPAPRDGGQIEAGLIVGTEAALHRAAPANAVVFLDFDQELLAPRFRASEEALGMLARASRLVGGRPGGRVVIQTRLPDHPAIRSAAVGAPWQLSEAEAPVRQALRLPPVAAIAIVSGEGAEAYALGIPPPAEVLEQDTNRWMVRSEHHDSLAAVLAATPRPPGKLRVEVDPQRA